MAIALADCASMRTDSVLQPCSVSQATCGDMMVPVLFWMKRTAVACSCDLLITAPPTVALWPSMYLVVLWIEMSAPSSNGRW